MPTPSMSDEELDSVFRRVADEYPDAVPPGAWECLEAKLSTAAASQQLRRRLGHALGAEVALVAVLLWLGYQLPAHRPDAAQPLASGQPARVAASRPGAPTSKRPVPSGSAAVSSAAASTATASTSTLAAPALAPAALTGPRRVAWAPTTAPTLSPAAATKTLGRPELLARNAEQSDAPASATAKLRQAGAKFLAKRKFGSDNALVIKYKRSAAASETSSKLAEFTSAQAGMTGDVALLAGTQPALLAVAASPLPTALGPLAAGPAPDSVQAPKRLAARPAYRLVVGVLGAPSFSAVRTPQSAQLGGDYGLTLEYRFTSRLRVRAGLISSQKRYRAASTDYVAPAAWQWFPGDYMLNANCRITEIPLDLRFDVLSRPGYTLFTSLGINSLLMRNERYSYDWTMNGQTFTKTTQVFAGSNHFLSVLNLSVGIERPIGGRWALQAEPFWQIPLGEVGAGQVRLSSAGANFSLKFNLLR